MVQKFPPHMTGKLYRKSLGLPDLKSLRVYGEKSWRVSAKFRGVKRKDRLSFLRRMSKKGSAGLSLQEMKSKRSGFDHHKITHLPMTEDCNCYACPNPSHINKATIRHHVVLLSRGGRNKRNNIVPLCNDCHTKLHPHMQKKHVLRGAVASRHCVKPKTNGPLVSLREDEKIRFVPYERVTAPGLGVTATL